MIINLIKTPKIMALNNQVIIYHDEPDSFESLEDFLDMYFHSQMKYFASDLLKEGFSTTDIRDAVSRAMTAGKTTGLNLRSHFALVYTDVDGTLVKDCKLSRLGYALLLLNAKPEIPMVGRWQMKILEQFL